MVLRVESLTKEYLKGRKANDDISFEVAAGEVLGLLGHNGAGKTTLVNQVAGLVRPTSGSISLAGRDPVREPAFARSACSIQPQAHAPLNGVTPRQAVEMLGRIRGGRRDEVRRRTEELFAALEMTDSADLPGQRLSGGIRRLTSFCMAAVEPGSLVLLDEPTNDVDPVRRRLLWAEVRRLADDGRAVIVVTHSLGEAERGVDRVVVLDEGRVVALGTPAELRRAVPGELRLELTVNPQAPALVAPSWAGPQATNGNRTSIPVPAEYTQEAVAWAAQLRAEGLVDEFALSPVTLEDVYIQLTADQKEARHDVAA
ncbi:ABC-2 type transport system ATP-binding protein [Micromonospora siamensis]|uniref:ABC-2 type transport system ATP-binding protein n=1 Tax=Micromonospora siamensis TaxID=299152 RepID=A0A1C5JQW6_9ACTN|nr:ABC-2 type transport system ATP-binding protein [Micromonospora siamensis]